MPDKGFLVAFFFFYFEHFELGQLSNGLGNFSDEKSDNLIEDPLRVMHFFSLATFRILSLSLAFESLIVMCLLWVSLSSLSWSLLNFLAVYIHVLHHIWGIIKHYFIKYSPSLSLFFFWDFHNTYISLCSLSFDLFFFLFLCLVISTVLYSSSLILLPAQLCLISFTVLFSLRTFLFPFRFCLLIDISISFLHNLLEFPYIFL